ncbi:MAG: hypothetical protein DRQ78_07945 [Epsilonproteobacteria bacterium]|nr:MAG: hypothetical protein DRQ78_07945 [Campylobacterota bacterium]
MKKQFSLIVLFSTLCFATNIQYESAYTDIDIDKNCKTIKIYNIGAIFDCGTFSNIKIEILSNDLRDSIDLLRDDKRYSLDFISSITSHFSELGKKIEWRYPKGQKENPSAMITRLNIQIEGETAKDLRTDSYLIVSKISHESICVVEKIAPQANQNKLARQIADKSSALPCIINREINERVY